MMGSIASYKMEEHVKQKLSSEEDEINQVIKPEYLKNSAVDNINVSEKARLTPLLVPKRRS